jgi:hypothetical protein
MVVRWGSRLAVALALVSVSALARGADLAAPVPPALPGAVADANGALAVVAQDGGVAGVDLSTGQARWRSGQGRWPLASAFPWVAVAAPDAADRRLLRVRFLRPADGAVLVDAKPIRLPAAIGTDASWEGEGLSLGAGNTVVHLSAWVPRPQRGPTRDPHAGRLRIRWKTASFIGGGGTRPSEPGPSSSGLVFVDPASGAVDAGPDDPGEGPEPTVPALPPAWRPARGTLYWNGNWFGGGWSDKPRAFRVGESGVAGFFSYESAIRRLVLNRFRPPEPLPAVEIAAGGEWVPQVSMDGQFLILSQGNAGVETFALHDLIRAGKPTRLPHLEPRFRAPFAVVGASLYYVAEGEGRGANGGATTFPRWLVCVDWAKGKIRWTHPLPSRFLPAPIPGAGPGLPR